MMEWSHILVKVSPASCRIATLALAKARRRYHVDSWMIGKRVTSSGREEPGIPEQHFLPASFVTGAENGSMPGRPHHHTTGRTRKRKRTSSSYSSFLEPNIQEASCVRATNDQERPRIFRAGEPNAIRDEDLVYASSSCTDSENANMRYRRKPRHKTRENLYDPTSPEKRKRKAKTSKHTERVKKQKKSRRPATLLQDFSAKNVAGDRLTVSKSYQP